MRTLHISDILFHAPCTYVRTLLNDFKSPINNQSTTDGGTADVITNDYKIPITSNHKYDSKRFIQGTKAKILSLDNISYKRYHLTTL
jgi:hypothetical protein